MGLHNYDDVFRARIAEINDCLSPESVKLIFQYVLNYSL